MINFISNLPKDMRSGGFSGLNAIAYATIRSRTAVNYGGPIDPPAFPWQKALSKLCRIAGSPGDFFFFSERRLERIADAVCVVCVPDARLDCFHGFTPWIATRPPRPYVAWSDCTFADYIEVYHRREQFRGADLQRIERAEADWLRRAQRVLFTSDWAARRALSAYALDQGRVGVIGICGEFEMPLLDEYSGAPQFAFVATNFAAKGGPVVLAAFREVRLRHPEATLVVVGDRPREAAPPGVEFTGFLRKEDPQQQQRLQAILGRSRSIVHPTTQDIAPLLIVEAGYFACPAISSRKFAIPELVDDRRTGLLLDDPSQAAAVAGAMNWMLENEDSYLQMRKAVWAKAREQHSRRKFEERLLSFVFDGAPDRVAPPR